MKTAAPLPAGTLLANGRYQLQQVLGQGGFAITYLALDTQLKRTVAIKELCPDGCVRAADYRVVPSGTSLSKFAQARKRFIEEAQLIAQLNHPGVVRIYDVFEQNNTGYIVMEYLHGETLAAKVARSRDGLPVEEAVSYILQVCDALDVVHQAGYIHRDIKPQNIIHCEDGRLVLIDFGAAREFVLNQTATYTVILTLFYAAPEQYSSSARLDPRTDIYGLAATLYHLVTGQPPIAASERISGPPLPPPHAIQPRVGEKLSQAIMQGLSMRIDERPQTVEQFMRLIENALSSVRDTQQLSIQPLSTKVATENPPPLAPRHETTENDDEQTLSFWSRMKSCLLEYTALVTVGVILGGLWLFFNPLDPVARAITDFFAPELIELNHQDSRQTLADALGRVRSGGTIRLKSGTYKLDKDVDIDKPINLEGAGSVFITSDGATIYFLGDGDSRISSISFENVSLQLQNGNFSIIGCSFVAKEPSYEAIVAIESERIEVDRCKIRGYKNGIIAQKVKRATISNCTIEENQKNGVLLLMDTVAGLEENLFRGNGESGIIAQDQSQLVARKNILESNGEAGIWLIDEAQGEIISNSFRQNGYCGIAAQQNSRIVAKNNICDNNKEYGVYLRDRVTGTVENNTCRYNRIGVYAYGNVRAHIIHNNCYSNKLKNIVSD